jgi:hypothetical protein
VITYEKNSDRLVKVLIDGRFAGWLERDFHRSTGLHARRRAVWSGFVSGVAISATSLTTAKSRITAAFRR